MKLEQQVTSLELAKRLKELGVTQESVFHYILTKRGLQLRYALTKKQKHQMVLSGVDIWSAFTVAELGEMLPIWVGSDYLEMYKNEDPNGRWQVRYGEVNYVFKSFSEATEADARAKMLIYLLENELITL